MRIIQLSDFHLSASNLRQLNDYYIDTICKDLQSMHAKIKIDVILFTGDLLDKGGESLGEDAFKLFQENIIGPIQKVTGLGNDRILLIPGNHDIDRRLVKEQNEYFLSGKLNRSNVNEKLASLRIDFLEDNLRVKPFKDFEKLFHTHTIGYNYSNNESTIVVENNEGKIGFALINDSWRCHNELKIDQHLVGTSQLFVAKKHFAEQQTDLNIAVFHHHLAALNEQEAEDIDKILTSQEYDIAFFGHSHKHTSKQISTAVGGYLLLNGRSAFNKPEETDSIFQPGYNILDVNIKERQFNVQSRIFVFGDYRFDLDTISLPDGCHSGNLPSPLSVSLAKQSNNQDAQLPDGYTADVDRIVKLLIGKSLYQNGNIFIRELIQNSVDACNRVLEKNSRANPRISVNVNTKGGFVEILDQGDGMSKHVLKNHFAVIGKSISQEYNEGSGHKNLISQFGIGFISTFINADKVIVSTKHIDSDQIVFEVTDVFKGFSYKPITPESTIERSGTSIRVYLKNGINPIDIYHEAYRHCRHIENLEIFMDSSRVAKSESWGLESAVFHFSDDNPSYEVRLGISQQPLNLTASNSGFFLQHNPTAIIPNKFPGIIGGEINFKPKAVDFDMSRSNILHTEKSLAVNKAISVSLRVLFRLALNGSDQQLVINTLNYLYYYLQAFDNIQDQIRMHYSDFYAKEELVELICKHASVKYRDVYLKLNEVLESVKHSGLNHVVCNHKNHETDYDAIMIQYLEEKGYWTFRTKTINIQLKNETVQMSYLAMINEVCAMQGLIVLNLNALNPEILADMKIDKDTFPEKIQRVINKIQAERHLVIEVGKFSTTTKPSVSNEQTYFLNYNHEAFQIMLERQKIMESDILEIYLLGILGLPLNTH